MKQERTAAEQQDFVREQQRVDEVTEQLRARLGELELLTGNVRDEVQQIRANFWEEVTVDFSTIDDAIESHASMKQHAETLAERERRYGHAFAEAGRVRRLIRSPYFGRIDVREQGEPGDEAVYVGIAGFVDKAGERYLIYDWRAPICSLYYDYVPGPCHYDTPGGTIAAEMLLKRQFAIHDGCLELMFDTGLTIGDELLQQVLGRTSDLQMKSIVATIQREQNRIIRNDSARVLVVQGVAGSGKTSAALQRAAYLLYKYRDQLHADQLLLFSPNPLFSSYVASVLPELGEENMRQTTFQAYLQHRLGGEFELEDPFAQLESLLADGEEDWHGERARYCGAAGDGTDVERESERGMVGESVDVASGGELEAVGEGTSVVSGGEPQAVGEGTNVASEGEPQAVGEAGSGEESSAGEPASELRAGVEASGEAGTSGLICGEAEWWLTDAEWWLIGAEWWLPEAEDVSQPAAGGTYCAIGLNCEQGGGKPEAEINERPWTGAAGGPRIVAVGAEHWSKEDRLTAQAVRLAGIRFKSSAVFVELIYAYAKLLGGAHMCFRPLQLDAAGAALVSEKQMVERFYGYDPAIRVPNRLELMREWLLERLAAQELVELDAPWVEEELELLDAEDYRRAYRELRKSHVEQHEYYEQERLLLARYVVRRRLLPLREQVQRLEFADVTALYVQLFADAALQRELLAGGADGTAAWPEDWPAVCRQTLQRLGQRQLAYEDAAPYLLLRELVLGSTPSTAVRHVFIDEAQDYSPFQLELLKRLFPRCRMTALGDPSQAIYAHASALELGSAQAFAALYGPEQTEVVRLQRSYRSTQEIVLFTRGMIPEGHAIEPFTRAGAKPRVTRVADRGSLHRRLAARAAELLAGGCATVAILCKTAGESELAAAALRSQLPELRLVNRLTPLLEPGVLVVPTYWAKGVEFDAVLVYDGSAQRYARERDRKLLYTACTRAMHELHIFSLGEPSPFILEQPEGTYELYM